MQKRKTHIHLYFIFLVFIQIACKAKPPVNPTEVDVYPPIYPDYTETTIPVNMAPLNFDLIGVQSVIAEFSTGDDAEFTLSGKEGIDIPESKWQKIVSAAAGKSINISVTAQIDDQWVRYKPFKIEVSADSIDRYLTYRLIEPGYELWNKMGLYQRDLSSFEQTTLMHNSLIDNGCINCHSFAGNSTQNALFHVRQHHSGTVVIENNKPRKIDIRNYKTGRAGTYPAFHPSGAYIAFSSNQTKQSFLGLGEKKISVYDIISDLIIYDVKNNNVIVDNRFSGNEYMETFPSWSPDGKYLYFCRSLTVDSLPQHYTDLQYGIYRVGFDIQTGKLLSPIDTIVDAVKDSCSLSFPRLSPDGRYLLYTRADNGTFPIFHPEADLGMIDLEDGTPVDLSIVNSNQTDSYHSWSSSGRWFIFSSKRGDGLYATPYIAYFDKNGKAHKPFKLPQKSPYVFYKRQLRSFNIPELTKDKLTVSPYELEKTIKKNPLQMNRRSDVEVNDDELAH